MPQPRAVPEQPRGVSQAEGVVVGSEQLAAGQLVRKSQEELAIPSREEFYKPPAALYAVRAGPATCVFVTFSFKPPI